MTRLWYVVHARLRSLFRVGRRESELDEELQSHLALEAERLEADGLSPQAARREASRLFGGVEAMKERCRDARGRAWLDTIGRDLRYAARSFRRSPLVATTIVGTVAVGLGLVVAVFTVLNAFVFRVDDVRAPHELFGLERHGEGTVSEFTRADYEALRRETDVFSAVFAVGPDVDRWVDGRRLQGASVSANFFDVLGAAAVHGRALMPFDEEAAGRVPLVLSHRAWTVYFGAQPSVVGREVLVNGTAAQVVGVMPVGFRGLELAAPDFWVPLAADTPAQETGRVGADALPVHIAGRLRADVARPQALAVLASWERSRTAAPTGTVAEAIVALEPRAGTIPLSGEVLAVFMPLFVAFGLVLAIGWANVANLLLARAVARQREFGIRLAIGASRPQVIGQLLTESLLLALAAAALAFAVSRVVLTTIARAVATTVPPDIGNIRLDVPPADWRVLVFLLAGSVVSTLCFALAPALYSTRLDLVRTMRGEVMPRARSGRGRHALVAVQVTGAVMLLVCAATFLRATIGSTHFDPGVRTADVVTIDIGREARRTATLATLRAEPLVAEVAASAPGGIGSAPANADVEGRTYPITYQSASPEYFTVLGIRLQRGRGFRDDERGAQAGVAIVSARVAARLWPGREPLGQALRLEAPPERDARSQSVASLPLTVTVVGIARDVEGFRFIDSRMPGAGVYLPTDAAAPGTTLAVRVHGDLEQARRSLADRLSVVDPELASVSTLRTLARMEAYFLGVAFWLTLALGMLALLLTLSGLYSVLSYLVAQRTRDIGVRTALGATRRQVGVAVVSQVARPVVAGLLVGSTLTLSLGAALLASPAGAAITAVIRLFDPVAHLAGVSLITCASACAALVPVWRATRIAPYAALRRE